MSNPTIPEIVCLQCFLVVGDEYLVEHVRWHERQEERIHAVEKQIEALVARIYFVERGKMGLPPTGDPRGHHHQAY